MAGRGAVTSPGAGRSRWVHLAWVVPALVVLLLLVVLAVRWFVGLPAVAGFLREFPGRSALPDGAPVGFPLWLAIQHYLSALFLLFIIRSGWQLRGKKRPPAFWTRDNTRLVRTKRPPVRIGLPLWFHLSVNALWVLNGVVFIVLLFATGQWMRIVPTSWDVIPNAVSAALQYASLEWPTQDGWIDYNALQLLSYFVVVFIAAPLAVVTGIRLAPGLAAWLRPLDRVFPTRVARAVHYPVMLFFCAFIVVHVGLVLTTGAIRNLNHMYGLRDDESWVGFWVFAAGIALMAVGWFLARPSLLSRVAARTGTVRR